LGNNKLSSEHARLTSRSISGELDYGPTLRQNGFK
jgi:hypothetical protein